MSSPLVSIIVAAYNVAQYLHKCVDSILCQTYSNIELILVDDGSTDDCGKICDNYARIDSRVKVIHKNNGGQSTARNAGLDIAAGDYIGFVDADDWIEPNMYETLLGLIINTDADIVQCSWYKVDGIGIKRKVDELFYEEIYTSDQGLDELIRSTGKHINTSVCSKLFKRAIALSCRFSPVRAYEDDEYVFRTVACSNRIICINTPLYNYLNRDNSTMTARFNVNKVALITIQKNICDLIKVRLPHRFSDVQKNLCSKQFYILFCLLSATDISQRNEMSKSIKDDILTSYDEYMRNPLMGMNKLMLFLIRYSPRIVWYNILKKKFT